MVRYERRTKGQFALACRYYTGSVTGGKNVLAHFFQSLPRLVEQLFQILLIFAVLGSSMFFIGMAIPRDRFDYTNAFYRPWKWERNGAIYEKLGIKKWKDRVPDMSKFVTRMYRKKLSGLRSKEHIRQLIVETCCAEMIHVLSMLLSPIFMVLVAGRAGIVGMVLHVLGNVPFAIIQRYNRPRLVKILERTEQAEARPAGTARTVVSKAAEETAR